MIDSRLNQVAALVDDARSLLVDIVDERTVGDSLRDMNYIDSARQFLNSALVYVQKADDTHTPPDITA